MPKRRIETCVKDPFSSRPQEESADNRFCNYMYESKLQKQPARIHRPT